MKIQKVPLTGLFIDKAPDREVTPSAPVEIVPPVEGEVPVVAEGEVVPVVPELIPGEWFWTLKARNGNVIAGNGGFNTSQSALKSIRATKSYFAKNKFVRVYNVVTGELKSNN